MKLIMHAGVRASRSLELVLPGAFFDSWLAIIPSLLLIVVQLFSERLLCAVVQLGDLLRVSFSVKALVKLLSHLVRLFMLNFFIKVLLLLFTQNGRRFALLAIQVPRRHVLVKFLKFSHCCYVTLRCRVAVVSNATLVAIG